MQQCYNNSGYVLKMVNRQCTMPTKTGLRYVSDNKTQQVRHEQTMLHGGQIVLDFTTTTAVNGATVTKDEMQAGLHGLQVTVCVAWCRYWNSRAASGSWHTSWQMAGSRRHSHCLLPFCEQLSTEERGFSDLQANYKSNLAVTENNQHCPKHTKGILFETTPVVHKNIVDFCQCFYCKKCTILLLDTRHTE